MSSPLFNFPNGPIYPGSQPRDHTGVNQLNICTVEATQRYVLGTRYLTWDGRVFKYCRSNNTCNPCHGAMNNQAPFIADDGATQIGDTTAVGDRTINVDSQTVAKDALAGGFVIIYATYEQFKAIIANTVGAATTIKITLENPLTQICTADSTDLCAYYSPYYGLANHQNISRASVMCMPAAYVDAANKFFWGQTWGPVRCSPGIAGFGNAAGERMLVFGENGALFPHNADTGTTLQYQHAGFIIPLTASADDAPLLMLQISI